MGQRSQSAVGGRRSTSKSFALRLDYYRRLVAAYLTGRTSHLTFWHDVPEVNERAHPTELGEYYMLFTAKANYPGPYDAQGIPLLDYHGKIGPQYNPIAIAQYGLGNYNLFCRNADPEQRRRSLAAADWLVANLERNSAGLWVWHHHFDWRYRTPLKAPWYSALAQGQGISLLVRAHKETGDSAYSEAARKAFGPFLQTPAEGGVSYGDSDGNIWLEEYIVSPPTHILNGFIWASWGIYDYFLATGSSDAKQLFDQTVQTLESNLRRYDTGHWSLYELSDTRPRMVASPFYHWLHIAQLRVMERLTGRDVFGRYAERWDGYRSRWRNRTRALLLKMVFKVLHY